MTRNRPFDKLGKLCGRSYARVLNLFMDDNNRDYHQTVLVAGSGRSGTTWLAELINADNDYRLIFEPFNDIRVPSVRRFRRRQFLDPEREHPEYFLIAQRILSGEFRHPWCDMFNRRRKVDRRIVKVIRANLFLRWLYVRFPGLKIVFILRHPFAVAHSKEKLDFGTNLDDLFAQPEIFQRYGFDYPRDALSDRSPFLQHVFLWCVENAAVLSDFRNTEIMAVFYEERRRDPIPRLQAIRRFIGGTESSSELSNLDRPSRSAQTTGPGAAGHQALPESEKQEALEMLDRFGMDRLYDASPDNLVPSCRMLPD